jgi:hypothetical protein
MLQAAHRSSKPLLAIGLYALALAAAMYAEFPWLALLPVVMLGVWLAIERLDALMLILVAAVPLSLNLEEMEIGGLP